MSSLNRWAQPLRKTAGNPYPWPVRSAAFLGLLLAAITEFPSAAEEAAVNFDQLAKLNPLEVTKAIKNKDEVRPYLEAKIGKLSPNERNLASAVLHILGDKSQESTVRKLFRDGSREERLLAALALRWNGDDSVIPYVLGLWGALYEQGLKHHDAETVPPDADLMAGFYCIQVLSKLEQENFWDVTFPYLSHTDPEVRKGAIGLVASQTQFCSQDPQEPVNQGYDYRKGAEANKDAIGRLREWGEKEKRKWEPRRKQRGDSVWGVKREDPVEVKMRRREELYAKVKAAQTAEEKKQAVIHYETFMREAYGDTFDVWIDYPGREKRPAPEQPRRLERIGSLAYQRRESTILSRAEEMGDSELAVQAHRRTIDFPDRADRQAPQILDGLAFIEHIRELTDEKPCNLQPRAIHLYAVLLVLSEGMRNAGDHDEWEYYNRQYMRFRDKRSFDETFHSAVLGKKAKFERKFAELPPREVDYGSWLPKLLTSTKPLPVMTKELESRIREVGERAYYYKLHWMHKTAKKSGDKAAIEDAYQKKRAFLLGEYGPPEIEEGLEFLLGLRKALQDEPVPMPGEQVEYHISLFACLNGILRSANPRQLQLAELDCREWAAGRESTQSVELKALIDETKSQYEQKLKTMK